jgi:anti-anti-sigma factor
MVRVEEATVRISQADSGWRVAVAGRVTVDSSPHLRSELLSLIGRSANLAIIIDLSEVSYLDMAGVATLLEVLDHAHARSISLQVAGITGQPRRLAELVDLNHIFRSLGGEVEFR